MSEDPLDQANRAILAIAALLVIFLAAVAALLAWGASDAAIGRIEDFAGFLRDHDDNGAKLVISLGAAVVALLAAMALIYELTPSPTQRMRVRNVAAGDAVLTTPEIAAGIEQEVLGVPHVAACDVIVATRGKGVAVVLDLQVDAGADLAQTADEACRHAHALVEERMGVTIAERPRARLHYRELRLRDDGKPPPPGAARHDSTGWERPRETDAGNDERPGAGASEEAQA